MSNSHDIGYDVLNWNLAPIILSSANLHPQSSVESGREQDNVSNEVMDFQIRDGAFASHLEMVRDETFEVSRSDGVGIIDFLKRPVNIYEGVWTGSTDPSVDLNLLQLFTADARVSNRINHYAYMSGVMCVRIACNGSPYHYGKLVAAVNHWPEMDTSLSSGISVYQAYQLPHIDVNPTMGVAGCLEIPLYHPHNAFPLKTIPHIVDLAVRTINPLRLAGQAPSDVTSIQFTVWAWMKEYELYSPTAINMDSLSPQADEYIKPSVSTGATAIANAFGALTSLPYVGKYMRISEMAMRVSSTLASLLGYSRPSSAEFERKITPRLITNLCNVNFDDACTKLSLDVKQEVTIDSNVTGYKEDDDMILLNIAKREGLVGSYVWDTTTSYLQRFLVSPLLCASETTSDDNLKLHLTPVGYVSVPFNYWRGCLKLRIEVVGSAFHRGKLRIVYDPYQPVNSDWTTVVNTNYNYLMDIANEREYVMNIGWATNRPYLHLGPADLTFSAVADTLLTDFDISRHNGTISMYVEHPLRSVAGDTNPLVYINAYLSAGDDFSLADPTDFEMNRFSNNYDLKVNSIEETPGAGMAPVPELLPTFELNKVGADSYTTNDKYALTFFGEHVISIRQLVKRYCAAYTRKYISETSDNVSYMIYNHNDFPLYGGYSPTGVEPTSAYGTVNLATYANYLTWYTPMFLMRRGGIRNKYILETGNGAFTGLMSLIGARSASCGFGFLSESYDFPGPNEIWLANIGSNTSILSGAQATLALTHPILEIECPYHSNKRFFFAQDRDKETNFNTIDIRREQGHKVILGTSFGDRNGFLRRYSAAADDYSLYMFKYTPSILLLPLGRPVS